ncbi:nuclease [Caulobacter zeae]|uniref:Nuclease n=1 Tax=Caulobacter zeae TaxID=2055137 RepID=A0A2N5DQ33_9CAUL|nr:thermonuclease family protein [Caulobacter zeae]PLR28169.1 nuclease [Caulobacter zeae]
MLAALALANALPVITCDAPKVHDGDTLRCGPERVRLFGVDAPEVKRGKTPAAPFAYEARDELIRLTRGHVACRFVERDRYKRFVGKCWSNASPDINAAVIRSGYATEYRRYSKGAYAKAEAEAKSTGRGHWAGR